MAPSRKRVARKNSRRTEVLTALGLVLAIATFLAQGPYDHLWQYLLVLAPLLAAMAIIRGESVLRYLQKHWRALIHAKEAYDWITGTDIESTYTVRVQNDDGDLVYERYFRIEVLREGVVESRTKQDLVGSEVPLPGFPPNADVSASRPQGIELVARDPVSMQTTRGGHPHFDYRWAYDIRPSLRHKGDFVEYSYSALIPRCEAKAFTEAGSLFFFLHESIALDVEYSLIAPPRFKIQIVDCWIEDADRIRIDIPDDERPSIEIGGQVMTWQPTYRKGHSYLCRYRLLSSELSSPRVSTATSLPARSGHY